MREDDRATRRVFSPSWVVISYFLVLGGLTIAAIALLATAATSSIAALAAYAGGAAMGGFFAGRASPHRAVLEPALAAALVVVSAFALMRTSALGELAFASAGAETTRTALTLAVCGALGGGIGTLIGELTQPREAGARGVRHVGIALLVTLGALTATAIVAGMSIADRAAQAAAAREVARRFGLGAADQPLVDDGLLVTRAIVALAVGLFLGGMISQMAARRRLLVASASGGFVVVAGGLIGLAALGGALADTLVPALLTGLCAFALAWCGALLAFVIGRLSGRLE